MDTNNCVIRESVPSGYTFQQPSLRVRCTVNPCPETGWLLTYLSSSSPVGHKATTMLRHTVLSFAEAWASPQDSPISFSSAITDCRHVIFGRPRFLFPGGVHLSATLGMLSWGIRRTCPSHLSRLRLISRTALLQPVLL